MRLLFDHGTLVLAEAPDRDLGFLPGVIFDRRVGLWRAPAYRHAELVDALGQAGIGFRDEARQLEAPVPELRRPELRRYQEAALLAWTLGERRGIAVLPTGSGKTRVALTAMADRRAPTLVLVPTRALMHQWIGEIAAACDAEVGCLGDGEHRVRPITVATFESAFRHMPRYGARFERLVVDEVHHFGAGLRDEALELCVATERLGLTATPPSDEALLRLEALVGPVVYQLGVADLTGTFLASLELVALRLGLSAEEKRRWDAERAVFKRVFKEYMRLYPSADWREFSRACQHSREGRAALAAWRASRRIATWTEQKARAVGFLLARHRDNKVLIFTADNDTAYAIARAELAMPITCDIGKSERDQALAAFRTGELRVLVSARVLNEGIDVPDAEVAIIVGATAGEREFVQRVGRLLRPAPGKRALVYELVTWGTSETRASEERRRALEARGPGVSDAVA